jgi:hypothetical protein
MADKVDETIRMTLEADDVQRGLREVGAAVALGSAGLFVGRGPTGFALIAGAADRAAVELGHGHMLVVGMTAPGLRALRDRCTSLLGDIERVELPDGLVIG